MHGQTLDNGEGKEGEELQQVEGNHYMAGQADTFLGAAEAEEEKQGGHLDKGEDRGVHDAIDEIPEGATVGRCSFGNVHVVDAPVTGSED